MFQFPASPAVGDVVNGYRYNGVGWAGGPLVGTPTNQFFDASGLTALDIQVPSWAKHARITGRVWTGAAQYVCMRISADGTTFLSGASDYVDGGSTLNSIGTVAQAVNTVVANAMTMTQAGDASQNTPQMIDTDINVWRPTASQYYEAKHYGRAYQTSVGHRGWMGNSYHASAALLAGTQLKALRILNGVGGVAFGAGSFFNVEWMAAAADIPQSNAVGDAPSDGRPYVRKNNLWTPGGVQLVSSTTFASKLLVDVALPDNYKEFQIRFRNIRGSAASSVNYLWAFLSLDGTTFFKTDSNYNWRQIYTASTGIAPSQWVATTGSAMGVILTAVGTSGTAGHSISGVLDIYPGDSVNMNKVAMNTQAFFSSGIFSHFGAGYLGAVGRMKAIRIQTGVGAGETFASGDLDLYGFQ